MSMKPFSPSAILTRLVVIGLGISLIIVQAQGVDLLHLDGSDYWSRVPLDNWINLLAPSFFLGAVWAASDVFARMHMGDGFDLAMVKGLREMGFYLMIGAFAAIVVQPSLIGLNHNGFSQMKGIVFALDTEHITIALVGLVMVILARQGQILKSKLDQFV